MALNVNVQMGTIFKKEDVSNVLTGSYLMNLKNHVFPNVGHNKYGKKIAVYAKEIITELMDYAENAHNPNNTIPTQKLAYKNAPTVRYT